MACWWGNNLGTYGGGAFGGWGTAGLIVSTLFFLLILVFAALLIVWLVRNYQKPAQVGATSSGSMEILKERYAKGEISREKFEEMRKEVGE
jgi:putative membrane protein